VESDDVVDPPEPELAEDPDLPLEPDPPREPCGAVPREGPPERGAETVGGDDRWPGVVGCDRAVGPPGEGRTVEYGGCTGTR
jgi:hypothetical protein